MTILVVEDEVRLADAICQLLKEEKYLAEAVYDGQDGYDYAVTGRYDVIIMDVMLPSLNGFQIISRLRKEHVSTPVLMLTAKDDLGSKITGLDAGADDYMTKPFEPQELLARIRALSRRFGEVVLDETAFGDLSLNLSSGDLSCSRSGKTRTVHLSFKEQSVLKMLLTAYPSVLSKEDMIVKIWGAESDAEDNNVEAYISFLRRKFFFIGSRVQIVSLRKLGYRLDPGEEVGTEGHA